MALVTTAALVLPFITPPKGKKNKNEATREEKCIPCKDAGTQGIQILLSKNKVLLEQGHTPLFIQSAEVFT